MDIKTADDSSISSSKKYKYGFVSSLASGFKLEITDDSPIEGLMLGQDYEIVFNTTQMKIQDFKDVGMGMSKATVRRDTSAPVTAHDKAVKEGLVSDEKEKKKTGRKSKTK